MGIGNSHSAQLRFGGSLSGLSPSRLVALTCSQWQIEWKQRELQPRENSWKACRSCLVPAWLAEVSAAFAAKAQGILIDAVSLGSPSFLLRQVCILAEGKHVSLPSSQQFGDGSLVVRG